MAAAFVCLFVCFLQPHPSNQRRRLHQEFFHSYDPRRPQESLRRTATRILKAQRMHGAGKSRAFGRPTIIDHGRQEVHCMSVSVVTFALFHDNVVGHHYYYRAPLPKHNAEGVCGNIDTPSMSSWACRSPRINPPAAGRPAVRPFYSNFDWLDYGLILLFN
jgi:hypothetical protein